MFFHYEYLMVVPLCPLQSLSEIWPEVTAQFLLSRWTLSYNYTTGWYFIWLYLTCYWNSWLSGNRLSWSLTVSTYRWDLLSHDGTIVGTVKHNNCAFCDKSNTFGTDVGLYVIKRYRYRGAANLAPESRGSNFSKLSPNRRQNIPKCCRKLILWLSGDFKGLFKLIRSDVRRSRTCFFPLFIF